MTFSTKYTLSYDAVVHLTLRFSFFSKVPKAFLEDGHKKVTGDVTDKEQV